MRRDGWLVGDGCRSASDAGRGVTGLDGRVEGVRRSGCAGMQVRRCGLGRCSVVNGRMTSADGVETVVPCREGG